MVSVMIAAKVYLVQDNGTRSELMAQEVPLRVEDMGKAMAMITEIASMFSKMV